MGSGADERMFNTLRQMRSEHGGLTLQAFKQAVREQYFKLQLDCEGPLAASPERLSADPARRPRTLQPLHKPGATCRQNSRNSARGAVRQAGAPASLRLHASPGRRRSTMSDYSKNKTPRVEQGASATESSDAAGPASADADPGAELSAKKYAKALKKLHVQMVSCSCGWRAAARKCALSSRAAKRRRQGRHDQGNHRARQSAHLSRHRASGPVAQRRDDRPVSPRPDVWPDPDPAIL